MEEVEQLQTFAEGVLCALATLHNLQDGVSEANEQTIVLELRIRNLADTGGQLHERQRRAVKEAYEGVRDAAAERAKAYGVIVGDAGTVRVLSAGHPQGVARVLGSLCRREQEALSQCAEVAHVVDSKALAATLESRHRFWLRSLEEEMQCWERVTEEFWELRDRQFAAWQRVSQNLTKYPRPVYLGVLSGCLSRKGRLVGGDMHLHTCVGVVYTLMWTSWKGGPRDARLWYDMVKDAWLNTVKALSERETMIRLRDFMEQRLQAMPHYAEMTAEAHLEAPPSLLELLHQ